MRFLLFWDITHHSVVTPCWLDEQPIGPSSRLKNFSPPEDERHSSRRVLPTVVRRVWSVLPTVVRHTMRRPWPTGGCCAKNKQEDGPVGFPETSVRNYHTVLCNVPAEHRSHVNCLFLIMFFLRKCVCQRTQNIAFGVLLSACDELGWQNFKIIKEEW
jgi:hypothetical protein